MTVVDPLAGRPAPAVVPHAPPSRVWACASRYRRQEKRARASERYGNPTLLSEVCAAVAAYRDGRHHWWTRHSHSMHVGLTASDVVAETENPPAPACSAGASVDTLGNRLVSNDGREQAELEWTRRGGKVAVITLPPRSAFVVTDLLSRMPPAWSQVEDLLACIGAPDVVLLDPPWPNRSVQRARNSYVTCTDIYDMWRLRPLLESVLHDEALVAVWVTNHPKVHDFVKNKFLRGFGLHVRAEWAWLKTVADGDDAGKPLLPLDTPWHRKPYEILVIASRCPVPVEQFHVLVCPPLGHSSKPNVSGLLLDAAGVRAGGVVLELFSRCAVSPRADAWHISVGNEACKYNVTAEGYAAIPQST